MTHRIHTAHEKSSAREAFAAIATFLETVQWWHIKRRKSDNNLWHIYSFDYLTQCEQWTYVCRYYSYCASLLHNKLSLSLKCPPTWLMNRNDFVELLSAFIYLNNVAENFKIFHECPDV